MLMFKLRAEIQKSWVVTSGIVELLAGTANDNVRFNAFIFNDKTSQNTNNVILNWQIKSTGPCIVIGNNLDDDKTVFAIVDVGEGISPLATNVKAGGKINVGFRAKTGENQPSMVGAWVEIYGMLIPMPIS